MADLEHPAILPVFAFGEQDAIPYFTMKLAVDNLSPVGEEGNSILTVFGVMFDSWQVNLPEDDFMLERLSFKARRIQVEDKEVSEA